MVNVIRYRERDIAADDRVFSSSCHNVKQLLWTISQNPAHWLRLTEHLLFASRSRRHGDACYLNDELISPHALLLLSVIRSLLMRWLISFLWQLLGPWMSPARQPVGKCLSSWYVIHQALNNQLNPCVWLWSCSREKVMFNNWVEVRWSGALRIIAVVNGRELL